VSALELALGMVAPSGLSWGEQAIPLQVEDMSAVLDESGPLLHLLTRARGGDKTGGLAVAADTVLVEQAPPRSRSYAVAADAGQAGLLVDAMAGFIVRTPGLSRVLQVESQRIVNVDTGASLAVLAADAAGAFGVTPYLTVVDEFAQWPTTPSARRLWEAVVSAVPKRPDARLVIITTAGDPSHPSYAVLEQARRSPRWRVSEWVGSIPWIRPEALEEQKALLLPSQYARLHENRWTEPDSRLSTRDAVLACVRRGEEALLPRPGRRYAVGVDLSVTTDYTVVAVAHAERVEDRQVCVVDRLRVWKPSRAHPIDLGEVEAFVELVAGEYGRAKVIFDKYAAVQMIGRLRRRGVDAHGMDITATGNTRRAVMLYRLLRDTAIELPDDPELVEELSTLSLRETTPGSYRLDTSGAAGGHHDRATAISLAVEPLAARTSGPASVQSAAGMGRIPRGPESGDADGSSVPRGSELDRRRLRVESAATTGGLRPDGRSPLDEMARARRLPGFIGPGGRQ
jgi:hypothetical protein